MPVGKEVISKYIKAHLNLLEESNFDEFLDTSRIYDFSEKFLVTFENLRDSLLEILDTSGIDYMSRMKHIPTRLFANNPNLKSIEIPSNIKGIGAKAFRECSQLQSVKISEGVEKIGLGAFSWCTHLTEVKLPESLHQLYDMAFSRCIRLKNITLPSSNLKYIPSECLLGTGIVDIYIPDSVEMIDQRAFAECQQLTKVSLGKAVTGANNIFLLCPGLRIIEYRGTWEDLKGNPLFKKFVAYDLPSETLIRCTDREVIFPQFLAAMSKVD